MSPHKAQSAGKQLSCSLNEVELPESKILSPSLSETSRGRRLALSPRAVNLAEVVLGTGAQSPHFHMKALLVASHTEGGLDAKSFQERSYMFYLFRIASSL